RSMSPARWPRRYGAGARGDERAGRPAGGIERLRRQLPVPARRLDLWRHERDPEEYPDQSCAGAVMDFEPSDDQRLLLESVSRMLADNYSFAQRKTYLAAP